MVLEKEAAICQIEKDKAAVLKDECEKDYQDALPFLKEAHEAINDIDKS